MLNTMLSSDFRGNLLIHQNQKLIYEKQQGFADLPNERLNQSTTRFASASAGKVFVSVGILQLVEKGLLKLDDTLGQLLPIDLHQIDPNVTVEELLTHTSGVPDYFDEEVMEEYEELWVDFPNYKIRSNSDILPLFIQQPMQSPRGTTFRYNNSGYVLLAAIIEEITKKPFDVYLKESIFDVCHMDSTGYFELDRLPARCATNYIYCEETASYRTNIFSVDAKGTGAGGAFITAEDIYKFWEALLEFRLISKEMVHNMLTISSQVDERSYYGYGVWIFKPQDGSSNTFSFQGHDPGVCFMSEYNPQKQTIITLVSNYGDNVWAEMKKIREVLY